MRKKVWVFGIGLFGGFLVEKLINVKNINLELIDKDVNKFKKYQNYNVPMHVLDSESYEDLKELEINPQDICVVAIGDNIGSSILTCQNLIELAGTKQIYVRVLNERHRKIINSMNVKETVQVHKFAGDYLATKIVNDLDLFSVEDEKYVILKKKNLKIDNITLEKTNIRKNNNSNIFLIKRKGKSIIPKGNTKIKLNDLIYIIIPKDEQTRIVNLLGNQKSTK